MKDKAISMLPIKQTRNWKNIILQLCKHMIYKKEKFLEDRWVTEK